MEPDRVDYEKTLHALTGRVEKVIRAFLNEGRNIDNPAVLIVDTLTTMLGLTLANHCQAPEEIARAVGQQLLECVRSNLAMDAPSIKGN